MPQSMICLKISHKNIIETRTCKSHRLLFPSQPPSVFDTLLHTLLPLVIFYVSFGSTTQPDTQDRCFDSEVPFSLEIMHLLLIIVADPCLVLKECLKLKKTALT